MVARAQVQQAQPGVIDVEIRGIALERERALR
jgi:hypothetical protein